jgi:undecaprenyl diphosphate synthase
MSDDRIDITSTENTKIPRHVAIIMDGNGRWAEQRNKARIMGHRAGVEAVRGVVEHSAKKGVEVLTLFAFSSENWRRPKKEVGLLMELFITALGHEVKRLHKNNVRLRVIGELSKFSKTLQKRITSAEELTKDNAGLTVVVAANYGGRWDVVQAVQRLAQHVKDGELSVEEITAERITEYVSLSDLPEPDFFIRTGGEQRISNFLLWQLAYTELYFTDTLWPDFNAEAYDEALASFAMRQRRFGRTGKQVADAEVSDNNA